MLRGIALQINIWLINKLNSCSSVIGNGLINYSVLVFVHTEMQIILYDLFCKKEVASVHV